MPKGKPNQPGTKLGRPTLYNPDNDEQVYKLCMLGMTNSEIARFFEVADVTFDRWVAANPSLRSSLSRGREIADAEMALSLYKRGMGFSYIERVVKRNAQGQIVSEYETDKVVPGDTAAASLWMRNRRRESFKADPQKDEESSETVVKVIIEGGLPPDLPPEESTPDPPADK